MNPKEISLHLMLSLNDNFDDDLLQDVVELIDYSKWENIDSAYYFKLIIFEINNIK